MDKVKKEIIKSQEIFRTKMQQVLESGGLSKERYIRFLTVQFYLTRGVQKHFYRIAGNSLLAPYKSLREWLVQFAKEEEFHFEIARKDLLKLDEEVLDYPFDVQLWWLYFDSVIDQRPFLRLGGTCVLENISNTSGDIIKQLLDDSDFLTPQNTRFLTIHQHGPNLDHGNQILDNLEAANLQDEYKQDLLEGCQKALIFYSRFMHWMIHDEILK